MKHRISDGVTFSELLHLVPMTSNWSVDWDRIWRLWPQLSALDRCPQDPFHHAEGDVGKHTRMVVEALSASAEWQALGDNDRSCLFWTAVLHDIGKPATTRLEEDGRITSRGHSRVGAAIARKLLWEADAPFDWREQVCGLIAAHQLPFWLIERDNPERLAIETSWKCRPDLLCLHALADALGRVCSDKSEILDNVALARQVFNDVGCSSGSFSFANDESRMAYFEKPDRDPCYPAHEEYRCRVTLMSGLPGAGKDTWIAQHRPELPVVSLDTLREKLGEASTGNQGRVIQAAYELAREYLRERRDFVWNATNVTAQLRAKPLRLFRDYGAHVEIVYLEPSPATLFDQNRNRSTAIPDTALSKLVEKLEPPGEWEAHRIRRIFKGNSSI
ncbi:MAG: AAA family ATPase [Pseudomonadota bacterium]